MCNGCGATEQNILLLSRRCHRGQSFCYYDGANVTAEGSGDASCTIYEAWKCFFIKLVVENMMEVVLLFQVHAEVGYLLPCTDQCMDLFLRDRTDQCMDSWVSSDG